MSLRARSNGGGTVRNGGGRGGGNGSPGGRGNNGNSDSYTVALLHLDGTNGANGPYTDSSSFARTFTNNAGGSISLSSLQKVFGTTSVQIVSSGASGNISSPSTADLQFGAGDFTVEWRYFQNGAYGGGNAGMVAKTGASGNFEWYFSFNSSSGINQWEWSYSTNGTSWITQQTSGSWTTSTWHAFALVRFGTSMYFYQDGTRIWTPTVSGTIRAGTGNVMIGDPLAGFSGSNRYIDEVRFSKGIARYTGATYTVATSAFTS